jgi:hypothetical protein
MIRTLVVLGLRGVVAMFAGAGVLFLALEQSVLGLIYFLPAVIYFAVVTGRSYWRTRKEAAA